MFHRPGSTTRAAEGGDVMERVTLIITEGPGSMRAWNALRLAAALVAQDMEVRIFLLDDGPYCAVRGQRPADGLREFNLAAKIEELLGFGIKVQCCSLCTEARGINESMLVDGVEIASTVDLARSIKESKHVISM